MGWFFVPVGVADFDCGFGGDAFCGDVEFAVFVGAVVFSGGGLGRSGINSNFTLWAIVCPGWRLLILRKRRDLRPYVDGPASLAGFAASRILLSSETSRWR